MFATNNTTSNNKIDALKKLIETDSSVRLSFAKGLTTTVIKTVCNKHDIKIHEFMVLRGYATRKVAGTNTNSFAMDVQKENEKEGHYVVKCGDQMKIIHNGVVMRADVAPFTSFLYSNADRVHAMLDCTKKDVSVIESSTTAPKVFQHEVLPLMSICETLNDNGKQTFDTVKDTLEKEIHKDGSNAAIINAMVNAAPPKLKPNVISSGSKKAIGSVKKFSVSPSCDTAAQKKIVDIMARNPYPKASYLNEFSNRHIFGIEIPKSVYKYVGLLYDCKIPSDCKRIHVHSSDVKYALALANCYSEAEVYYISSVDVGKKSTRIMGIREERMYEEAQGAFGIFINYVTPPMEKDKDHRVVAIESDTYDIKKAKTYKHWFRYLSVFAMQDGMNYKPSLVTSRAQVCQSTEITNFYCNANEMVKRMAGILMHRYAYVWNAVPLICLIKWYEDIDKFTISLVMSKEQMKSLVSSSFSKFIDESSDDIDLFAMFADKEAYEQLGIKVQLSDIAATVEDESGDGKTSMVSRKLINEKNEEEEDDDIFSAFIEEK